MNPGTRLKPSGRATVACGELGLGHAFCRRRPNPVATNIRTLLSGSCARRAEVSEQGGQRELQIAHFLTLQR